MFCVKCGTEYEGQFCPHCGAAAPKKRFCPQCGKAVEDPAATVCDGCGAVIPKAEDPAGPQPAAAQPTIIIHNENNNSATAAAGPVVLMGRPKRKWTAFFLCLFLGYLGAHKFYEGKTGMGILYLCTLGLLGFGWLIDCIILLMKPDPYFV